MISITNINANLGIASPEIFLVGMILLILIVDAFIKKATSNCLVVTLTAVSLIGAAVLQFIVANLYLIVDEPVIYTFNKMFALDSLAAIMNIATLLLSLIILIYIKQYLANRKSLVAEFYIIFLFAILGMMVMISANSLLILYVGLELLSLALYGLVAINHDNVKSIESAMKFFILGALASGLLLYGISFIYGATGGYLNLNDIATITYNNGQINHSILIFGLVFIVAGLVFKLGLAPFHMWVPDVYEGSSLPVTTIIGSVTKIAAVIFVIRFLVGGLMKFSIEWSVMLSFLAFVSLFIGNVIAIAQTNIKRMLGYSTVAHMGFIVLGLIPLSGGVNLASANSLIAVLFYLLTYVLTALAGFGVLLMLSSNNYECEKIDDLKGLSTTHPIYAGVMLLVMFSLAGIPPLVGFYAKFKILEALVSVGYIRTAIYAVVMSLIGAFYYLRVVKVMYFDDKQTNLELINAGSFTKSIVIINGALLLILGIMPNQILKLCASII